jgi:hypothetical protein
MATKRTNRIAQWVLTITTLPNGIELIHLNQITLALVQLDIKTLFYIMN